MQDAGMQDAGMQEFPRASRVAPRLDVIVQTGSTNADIIAAMAEGASVPHLATRVTRDQRAGRGRLDRTWIAPPGSSLAISVVVRVPAVPPGARGWIPLAAGAAMVGAVAAQLPGHDVGVKWPNDVLVDGRKICGILAEVTSDADAVVIGSGVNTAMAQADLPVPTATSFAALGTAVDDDALLERYLTDLDRLLTALVTDPDAVRAAVTDRCVTLGREVTVFLPDGSALMGLARALEADGRLVVAAAGRDVAVAAGDVVHLR